jgi:hypothetical protein
MRSLIAIVLAAAGLWSGYWLIGSRGVESGLRGWLDERWRQGWVASHAGVETHGFPNRFDTTITDLELADPATGVVWSAPFLQLFRLSYRPDHVIAVWPDRQALTFSHQRLTITSDDARGSFVFKPGTEYQIERSSVVFSGVALVSSEGWSSATKSGLLATRRNSEAENAVDIAFEVTDLHAASPALAQLAETGAAPAIFQQLKIDATVGFDAPWDRAAIETRRPAITTIDLGMLQARSGQLDLRASGNLTLNRAGLASGSIAIRARNWREMLQIAVALGWIPERLEGPLESGLKLQAGSPETVDASLTFRDGQVSLGPIPLGSLPPLRLR